MRIIILLLMFLVSCGAKESSADKTVLTVAVPIEATGLYPYIANDPHSSRVNRLLFDNLVVRDVNGKIIPSIAESWEQVSPTMIDFTIREGVKFHNGDLLTVEDVKFSFEEILKTPNLAHTVVAIKGVEITPDGKFRIVLKYPYAPAIPLVGYSTFKIVNKAYVESNRQEISQSPMGTGPYKLKEWNRGNNIILERHDDFWGEVARIPEVTLRTVNDPVSRALALETGDVDIAYDIEGSDKDRIEVDSNLVFLQKEIARVEYIAMNIGKGKNPLWKDPRGRQAFAYALDLDGIVNSVLFGMGSSANSLLSPVIDGFDKELPKRVRDVEKAKQLIAETGIQNPKMTMWVREGISQKTGEIIQANLHEIGVDVSLEVVEYARFLEGIAQGEHDTFILNWSTITIDADYGLNNLLNSQSWGSKGNRSFYANTEVDELLALGQTTLDQAERDKIYKKVQEIVFDDVPYIPVYYTVMGVGMHKSVKGFIFDVAADYTLNTVYFD